MDLKQLNINLKEIVDKHIKVLPDFNSTDEVIVLLKRNKYASENITFNNEINKIVEEYLLDKELDISDKEKLRFLIKHHKTKYIYGFNSPGDVETYEMLFGNQI
ncbi:hypothetical protein [Xanthomarina gelatinilytica]|uniref:hypothetical protein n=1 Tax=Xanthomarina gelatinilytica TaxID=1137281 RepID=UPI003AA8AD36